jgi:hypothetical protein
VGARGKGTLAEEYLRKGEARVSAGGGDPEGGAGGGNTRRGVPGDGVWRECWREGLGEGAQAEEILREGLGEGAQAEEVLREGLGEGAVEAKDREAKKRGISAVPLFVVRCPQEGKSFIVRGAESVDSFSEAISLALRCQGEGEGQGPRNRSQASDTNGRACSA